MRLNPLVADWLEQVARREGWTNTDAAEWALDGVRSLEHRLGTRLERFLDEQREGGESLFTEIGRRLEASFPAEDLQIEEESILPKFGKHDGRSRSTDGSVG